MSALWLLLILGSAVNLLTNAWRHGDIDLTGKDANMRGVYMRSVGIGIALCLLLRVNIVDIVAHGGEPRSFIGWLGATWDGRASAGAHLGYIFDQIVGIATTGVVVAVAAKFWNDSFDILYEFKRWLRGNANALKPEPRAPRDRSQVTRRTRGSRRRGGGGGGNGEGGRSRDQRGQGQGQGQS